MTKRTVVTGAVSGLRVWFAYGIIELVLTCFVPALFHSDTRILPWQWRLIAMIFGVYALAGVVFGAAGAAFVSRIRSAEGSSEGAQRLAALLSLVLAFVANLLSAWPLAGSEYLALGIAIVLSGAFFAALISNAWLRRVRFLANPWAVSLLLLGAPWLSRDELADYSTVARAAASMALLGMIVAGMRWWRGLHWGSNPVLQRAVLAAKPILLVWMAVAASNIAVSSPSGKHPGRWGAGKPNVLLITMDTVRADHCSVYGYSRDTTPRLRDFSRGATVYNRAIAASDLTLSSHASIFTGLYPNWHGAYTAPEYPVGRPLSPNLQTIARILRSSDFETAAFAANLYLRPAFGLINGFAIDEVQRPAILAASVRPAYLREGARKALGLVVDTTAFFAECFRAEDINREAFAFLDQAKQRRPFFLFLNYMDAHPPYTPPTPFDSLFPGRDDEFQPLNDYWAAALAVNSGKRSITDRERRHLVSQYDGGIAYMDAQIGKLLARLKELRLYDQTLIFITSDHGQAFGERNLVDHALGSVYQNQIHVPLLVKYPGQREANRYDELVSHVDFMPTILEVAGCAKPAGLQGRSLLSPGVEGKAVVYARATSMLNLKRYPRFRGVRMALFSGNWKMIEWTKGPPELYDLASDPEEQHNLYRSDDPVSAGLTARLSEWVASMPRQTEPSRKPDKATMERLKSLGYLQ